jgi:ADP-ribose pyrophosphatase YjhB (NUDIX family)
MESLPIGKIRNLGWREGQKKGSDFVQKVPQKLLLIQFLLSLRDYKAMPTKSKIGVLIVNNKDELLLIKEKIKKNPEPRWNIIKGTYGDIDDESVFDTAVRECKEEISVDVKLQKALGCYIARQDEKIRIQFNFQASIISGEPKILDISEQDKNNESISEFKWFTKKDLKGMEGSEFISNRIYEIIKGWINGQIYPLDIYKQISM